MTLPILDTTTCYSLALSSGAHQPVAHHVHLTPTIRHLYQHLSLPLCTCTCHTSVFLPAPPYFCQHPRIFVPALPYFCAHLCAPPTAHHGPLRTSEGTSLHLCKSFTAPMRTSLWPPRTCASRRRTASPTPRMHCTVPHLLWQPSAHLFAPPTAHHGHLRTSNGTSLSPYCTYMYLSMHPRVPQPHVDVPPLLRLACNVPVPHLCAPPTAQHGPLRTSNGTSLSPYCTYVYLSMHPTYLNLTSTYHLSYASHAMYPPRTSAHLQRHIMNLFVPLRAPLCTPLNL